MNSNKKIFSKIGFNYLIYAISAFIIMTILTDVITFTKPELLNSIEILTILSSISNYLLPFPILVFLMKKLDTQKLETNKLNVKTFLIYICITITLMLIGNIIGLIITNLLGGVLQIDISNPAQNLIHSAGLWLNVLLISIIGPIFEEYFFRKLLIDRTIKYGARVSIILSAILFGLFHGNLNQFFYCTLIGGFFAYVYIKTGKLTYTILLHIIINMMGSVVSLFWANSFTNLTTGAINSFDLSFVLIYTVVLIIMLVIGLTKLLKYKKAKFNGQKTEISLKQPLKTMFLNIGMICFIMYFIIKIIMQIIG
ncbi:CPBP family intramembrane glutamic endopeptidase [Methanobrevibacter sp.]|uniref:CPBP family intramembrane glutamic endopeptidase n=1 Tax=Methanobrevibacter sp. TaxID=66852 RepID=UPI003D7CB7BD